MNQREARIQELEYQLECAINQRNHAQNECISLGAQVKAALRRINELDAMIKAKPNGTAAVLTDAAATA